MLLGSQLGVPCLDHLGCEYVFAVLLLNSSHSLRGIGAHFPQRLLWLPTMQMSSIKLALIILALLDVPQGQVFASDHVGRPNEPAFGIELTLDDVRVAVATPDSQPVGLVSVQGDEAYKCLMRSYLELCERVQESQMPPWDFFEYRNNLSRSSTWHQEVLEPEDSWRDWFQVKILGKPEAPWSILRKDNFAGDADVAILAEAMKTARSAAGVVLQSRLNITLSQHPFVSIAAPSFPWTTMEPKSWEGHITDWSEPDDNTAWLEVLNLKFAGAAHRAGFRRHEMDEPRQIMEGHATLTNSPVSPASCSVLLDMKDTLDQRTTTIVVEWNNATLSFWIDGPQTQWTPWSTYPDLGGHVQAGKADRLWPQAAQALQRLLEEAQLSDQPANFLLTGDAWNTTGLDLFKESIQHVAPKAKDIQLKGKFAGSLGAASTARYALHAAETCVDPYWKEHELNAQTDAADREL